MEAHSEISMCTDQVSVNKKYESWSEKIKFYLTCNHPALSNSSNSTSSYKENIKGDEEMDADLKDLKVHLNEITASLVSDLQQIK